jgi:Ferritin-like
MPKKSKQQPKRPAKKKRAKQTPTEAAGQPEPTTTDKSGLTRAKIFPRNLTARAEFLVPGNPMVTRPEDAMANCFPGLEIDVRNLDRRFFPGLVFNFVDPSGDAEFDSNSGAKLAYVDVREDPDLQLNSEATQRLYEALKINPKVAQALYNKLTDSNCLPTTVKWYLDWLQVGKKRISMHGLPGSVVWRLVRGLEQGPVSIALKLRDKDDRDKIDHDEVVLHGWRRRFTDPVTGVISTAYQPGELMQGLCSPWQHDFRDCYCHYWASNRPDLVFGEVYPGEPLLPDGEAEDPLLNIRLDWMRAYRSRELAVGAFGIIENNRPYQFDHYQINHQWQNLNIVLDNREIDSVHLAAPADAANPFESADELADYLKTWLAPLELTLVFEYLYARFSLLNPSEVDQKTVDAGAVALAQENLLLIAASEMQHMRWGNEILWELHKAGKIARYDPILTPSKQVPQGRGGPLRGPITRQSLAAYVKVEHKTEFLPRKFKVFTQAAGSQHQRAQGDAAAGWRDRALRPLTRDVQQDFINIEHPSAYIDSAYARVVATLRKPEYPANLVGLAQRIVSDGVQHESRFNAIKAALAPFDERQYLRGTYAPGQPKDVSTALELRDSIIKALHQAYTAADNDNLADCAQHIANARGTMNKLLSEGEHLARDNIGIPFFDGF